MSDKYLYLPGASGNYVSVPDTNLLDADTAHVYQSKGEWNVGSVVTDEPSQFGGSAIEYEWPASGQKYWQTVTTSQTVTPSADYAASVTFKAATAASLVDEQARLILGWRDVADANISYTYGTYVSVSDDGWVTLTATGTAPVGSDHCRLVVNFNVGTTVVCSIGSASLRAGSDATFVPSLRIVGDRDITVKTAPIDLTTSPTASLMSKWGALPANQEFNLYLENDDVKFIIRDSTGFQTATWATTGLSDGDTHVFRFVQDRTANEGKFYLDGSLEANPSVTWRAAEYSDDAVFIGNRQQTGYPLDGKVYYAELRDGIDGPLVADVDFTDLTAAEVEAASFTDATGYHTVTLNGDAWAYVEPYESGGVLSRAELLLDASNRYVAGSPLWPDLSGNDHHAQYGSAAGADTNDPLFLPFDGDKYLWLPGVAGNNLTIPGLSVSTAYDYTVTYEDDTTATGEETTDGSGNLVLGNTQSNFDAKSVKFIDVVPDGGGATVAYLDLTGLTEAEVVAGEFVEDEGATVTLNGDGWAYVDRPMFHLTTDDYFEVPDHADLDIDINGDYTLIVVARAVSPPASDQILASKVSNFPTGYGYSLYIDNPSSRVRASLATAADGFGVDSTVATYATRTTFVASATYDGSEDDLLALIDGDDAGESPTSNALTESPANAGKFVIGATNIGGGSLYAFDGQIAAVAFWREALTDLEVAEAGERLLRQWDGTWDGEILATVKSHISYSGDAGELLGVLRDDGATSHEVVGALNEMNGTVGVGFEKALRTYLNIE